MATDLKSNKQFMDLAARMRRRIVAGQWAPGTQLPTWDQITEEFSVARPTLMRAMDRLRRDGFIYSRSTRGTYVTERPPHLSRFGLVFTSHPGGVGERSWNRFWDTLANIAPQAARAAGVQLPVFLDLLDQDGEGVARLREQLAAERLGGLILVGTPALMRLPLLARASVPKVAIYDQATDPPMPRVYVDHRSFIEQSLDRLAAQGRRRIAVVSNQFDGWAGFEAAIAARSLDCKPFWRLAASPGAVANVIRLLFDPDNAVAPDGLILADDNIVEHALRGLIEAGVAVPARVAVVTHCNWPAPVPSTLQVQRLGYDVAELLRACLDCLRRGPTDGQDHVTLVPARWEIDQPSSL